MSLHRILLETKKMIIKIKGKLTKILIKKDSKLYTKFVAMDNIQPVLYFKLIKDLDGLLKSALLL